MESSILDALQQVLPMLKDIIGQDFQLSLCDRTTALATWPADSFSLPSVELGRELDRSIPGHRNMIEVMESGRRNESILPKQVLGVPVKGILTPVRENGKVVGLVACAYSLEKDVKIQESVEALDTSLNASKESLDQISKEAEELAEKIEAIRQATDQVRAEVKKAFDMIHTIEGNASRSNILALNASIEAARSGTAGRGFAVVASEMGKLAQMSGSSAKAINDSLNDIITAVDNVKKAVDEVNNTASVQATDTKKVTDSLHDITRSVSEITEYSKKK